MSDQTITNEIMRMSLEIDFISGAPPEPQVRFALVEVFTGLAMAVRYANLESPQLFPVKFPMQLTLESEQLRWDFRIVARLENSAKLEEVKLERSK
jgi:hypothetical protein